MFRLFSNVFYHPPTDLGGGPAPVVEPATKDDIFDFLADEGDDKETIKLDDKDKGKDKDKDKDKEKEDKETDIVTKDDDDEDVDKEDKDDTKDELDEIEEDLKEPDEEKLELVTPVARREILKKYPNVFKDFPYLEKAYYREQQYTEILPTIDDAKEAVEAVNTLRSFEEDLGKGDTEKLLAATKRENPRAFNKLVDNYMRVLHKVDEKSFNHVVGNVAKQIIAGMVSEGGRLKNDALKSAALLVNQYVFASSDYKPPTDLSTDDVEDEEKETSLDKERKEFAKQRFEVARDDLNSRVNNSIKNTIDAHLDPNKSMSDYVRRTATREALEEVTKLIDQDKRFKIITDKLWENAFKKNFSKESVEAIRTTYFSKAKTLLPSVIKKARNEALKGMGRRVKQDDTTTDTPNKGQRKTTDEPTSRNTGKIKEAKDIPKGMSTLEFLNSD